MTAVEAMQVSSDPDQIASADTARGVAESDRIRSESDSGVGSDQVGSDRVGPGSGPDLCPGHTSCTCRSVFELSRFCSVHREEAIGEDDRAEYPRSSEDR